MSVRTERTKEIKEYVLANVQDHPTDIVRMAAKRLRISRQSVTNHIRGLVKEGMLSATGRTRGRRYELVSLVSKIATMAVTPRLEEHIAWRDTVSPLLSNVADNVLQICQYGLEEMVNNVVSHSSAHSLELGVTRTAVQIRLRVSDDGVGVFNRIQKEFGYDDPRHALLELSKGKITSDPDRHTGEGIFFTSRMFDEFTIWSGTLFYSRRNQPGNDWLLEVEDRNHMLGTFINMVIHPNALQTMSEVFDRYATGEEKGFSRTHVPIKLARYETEQLLSRSQARRVLARFDRFREVLLDFQGVEQIGQAFADEIFRVFRREHPEIDIYWVNDSPQVRAMIGRAQVAANASESPP